MKKLFKLMPLACLMAASSSAFAAGPSATLQVQGSVTQGACIPTLTNGGLIDLGDIKADEIPDYSNNYSQINIKCSNPKIVVFEFIDNRRDSNWAIESGKGHLSTAGLGKTSTGKNIGYYEMIFNTESLSGAPSNLGVSVLNQGSSGWRDVCCSAVSMGISGGQLIGFFDKAASGDSKFEPVAITEQTITFNANVVLQKSAFGGISDSESVDGSLTMALKYI